MNENRGEAQSRRVGNTAKCPACGWGMDSDAYRCPKCHIYFCFKCRARVTERQPQFQCADQSCCYYGKLLCSACTVMVPEFKDVTRQEFRVIEPGTRRTKVVVMETENGTITYTEPPKRHLLRLGRIVISVYTVIAVVIIGYAAIRGMNAIENPHWLAKTTAVLLYTVCTGGIFWIGFAFLSRLLSYEKPDVPEKREYYDVTENKQVAEHRCCIQCRHPAKVL